MNQKFKMDEIEYDLNQLNDNAKAQYASLQFLSAQMEKIQAEIAVYQTARNAYVAALKAELSSE
jgi:hypothetical protein